MLPVKVRARLKLLSKRQNPVLAENWTDDLQPDRKPVYEPAWNRHGGKAAQIGSLGQSVPDPLRQLFRRSIFEGAICPVS